MKTRERVLEEIKAGKKSQTLDGRDFGRLAMYFEDENVKYFGFDVKPGKKIKPKKWTKKNILKELEKDLAFAFYKALDKRGISSGLMHDVIKMWLWVLDDPLMYCEEYAQYGLPLYKKVAVKYGFKNQIGEDYGNESKYASEEVKYVSENIDHLTGMPIVGHYKKYTNEV